jgi:hypothetical protein
MLLQRDVMVLLLALGVAAALYVVSFRDLLADATPAADASFFVHGTATVPAAHFAAGTES